MNIDIQKIKDLAFIHDNEIVFTCNKNLGSKNTLIAWTERKTNPHNFLAQVIGHEFGSLPNVDGETIESYLQKLELIEIDILGFQNLLNEFGRKSILDNIPNNKIERIFTLFEIDTQNVSAWFYGYSKAIQFCVILDFYR